MPWKEALKRGQRSAFLVIGPRQVPFASLDLRFLAWKAGCFVGLSARGRFNERTSELLHCGSQLQTLFVIPLGICPIGFYTGGFPKIPAKGRVIWEMDGAFGESVRKWHLARSL